jgi:hypothetical protein
MISVLHIGLPLLPPWLTEEEATTISVRLGDIRQKMKAAGYHYQVLHASPPGGLNGFRERLGAERIDAVLIGGGVAGDPKLAAFKQQIIDATQEEAPDAKVLEYDHALEVPSLVGRAFEMP